MSKSIEEQAEYNDVRILNLEEIVKTLNKQFVRLQEEKSDIEIELERIKKINILQRERIYELEQGVLK